MTPGISDVRSEAPSVWARLPERVRMWSPWWLRHVLAVERTSHNRTMADLRAAEQCASDITALPPE